MKILTSYFYQLRFFTPNMIPLSTCLSDPKWFHDGKGKQYYFKDKNGVWNGLRAEPFVPKTYGEDTPDCVGRNKCNFNPESCPLAEMYQAHLDKLNFEEILGRFESLAKRVQNIEGFKEEPIMVLMVYEPPDNPCSEREAIQAWFAKHGYPIKEFQRESII